MLTLRDAAPADAEEIVGLIRELAAFERLAHECVVDAALLDRFLFEERRAHALIAQWEGTTAGFALYFYNFSTFLGRPGLYLEDIFVRPPFRRNGIAKAVFRFLAKKAIDQGCGRMEWAVLDWNENAVGFYGRMGAVPMAEWTTQRLTGDALKRLAEEG
ncbi:MAG: GNAT family N-acetyltransferase [Rhizomicrobium sp.]